MAEKEQRSREFGIRLAKVLRDRAAEAAVEHDLDVRYVVLGAGEYLRRDAKFRLDPPLDSSRTNLEERGN